MITEQQTQAVKNTWGKIAARSNALGDTLYPKLFAKRPELEELFSHAKATASQKLFMFVMLIVTKLDKLDNLREELQNLAKRHIRYQVKPEYFQVFGECFIESIAEILGKDASQEVLDAWTNLYATISRAMIEDMQSL